MRPPATSRPGPWSSPVPPPNAIRGPLRLGVSDVDEINRVFSEAFTERYHRDGMTGVRVPPLNPAIWRFAIAAAGDGALHWRDAHGHLAAFNIVHTLGHEGWMGPLAVRPDCQGRGVGRRIVQAGVDLLKAKGCRVIGLETMPRTVDNIGFYSGMGFRPAHLTVSLIRETQVAAGVPGELASRLGPAGVWLDRLRALVAEVMPGLDLDRETGLTLEQALGDLTVVRDGNSWRGAALWHSAPLALGRPADELRVLKLVAKDRGAFRAVVQALVAEAAARGLGRVAIRCQTGFREAYGDLMELGFRVHWTDLRMVLADHPEVAPRTGVVFSNWEI